MKNELWTIDKNHPFDAIGFIKEEKKGLFRKGRVTLVIHEIWMKYCTDSIQNQAERVNVLEQSTEVIVERHDMKINQENPFYGDEAGFEQYCRMKYKKLLGHILNMIDKIRLK